MSGTSQQPSHYPARSPTLSHYDTSYSPTNGSYARPSYNPHNPQNHPPTPAPLPLPPSAQSPHHRPPLSPPPNGLPAINGSGHRARDKPTSTYYDPTSDHGDQNSSWSQSRSANSPNQQVSFLLRILPCAKSSADTRNSLDQAINTLRLLTTKALSAALNHPR